MVRRLSVSTLLCICLLGCDNDEDSTSANQAKLLTGNQLVGNWEQVDPQFADTTRRLSINEDGALRYGFVTDYALEISNQCEGLDPNSKYELVIIESQLENVTGNAFEFSPDSMDEFELYNLDADSYECSIDSGQLTAGMIDQIEAIRATYQIDPEAQTLSFMPFEGVDRETDPLLTAWLNSIGLWGSSIFDRQ